MQVPVYLINLDRSPERLAAMKKRLEAQGVEYTRFSAVDGKLLRLDGFADDWGINAQFFSGATPGEIGCFLSHFSLLSKIAAGEHDRACFLEDDVELDPEFHKLLAADAHFPKNADFVRLELLNHQKSVEFIEVDRFEKWKIVFLPGKHAWAGTGAYMVTRRGAQKAVSYIKSVKGEFLPIDALLFRFWNNGLTIYQSAPLAAWQTGPSLIEEERGLSKKGRRAAPKRRFDPLKFHARRLAYIATRIGPRGLFWKRLPSFELLGQSAH